MKSITPLILCGGSGARLWPLSRQSHPKQFQPLRGDGAQSFFQKTVARHAGRGFTRPIVVSAVGYRDQIRESLRNMGRSAQVILEPSAQGTGPAVLAAALVAARQDPRSLLLVSPSDHMIRGDMSSAIQASVSAALAGHIVVFGIKPRYAETGYGYVLDAGPVAGFEVLRKSGGFVEKPSQYRASELLASGSSFWASGISLFTAETIINEFARVAPKTLQAVRASLPEGHSDEITLGRSNYLQAYKSSTEVLIFENSERLLLAPVDVDWSDVGCWTSMHRMGRKDGRGNVLEGDILARDTKNSYVRSDGKLVAVVGMQDVIVVDTEDALLVTRRGQCQDVARVVDELRLRRRTEGDGFL